VILAKNVHAIIQTIKQQNCIAIAEKNKILDL
jgi:hypothetical protein